MTNREIQVIRILGMSLLIGLITIILKPKCIFDGASNQQIFTAFIGALLALALNLIIRLIYFKNRLIRTYACAGTRNNGTETEFEGELMHHYGEPGNENSNEVWIHRKNSFECGKPIQFKKDATLYGPYSTDCGNPGYYKAVFRVKFNPGTNSRTEYKNL